MDDRPAAVRAGAATSRQSAPARTASSAETRAGSSGTIVAWPPRPRCSRTSMRPKCWHPASTIAATPRIPHVALHRDRLCPTAVRRWRVCLSSERRGAEAPGPAAFRQT
jgi:hypothetical protein